MRPARESAPRLGLAANAPDHAAQSPSGLAVREIAAALGLAESPWTIREDLAALKGLGLVVTTGWGRGARWELVRR